MSAKSSQFGILIVAHGGLAEQYLATMEHVLGKQSQVGYVSIDDKDDREERRQKISEMVKVLDSGGGVVIVTDMFGGTPSNLALHCDPNTQQNVLFGASMPSIIKLARSRHLPMKDALDEAVHAGRRYLDYQATD